MDWYWRFQSYIRGNVEERPKTVLVIGVIVGVIGAALISSQFKLTNYPDWNALNRVSLALVAGGLVAFFSFVVDAKRIANAKKPIRNGTRLAMHVCFMAILAFVVVGSVTSSSALLSCSAFQFVSVAVLIFNTVLLLVAVSVKIDQIVG